MSIDQSHDDKRPAHLNALIQSIVKFSLEHVSSNCFSKSLWSGAFRNVMYFRSIDADQILFACRRKPKFTLLVGS